MEVLSYYLPQYHPIPENDVWWGPGFTEWNMVTAQRPLFRGHVQPHLPRDLGLYDLRSPETRIAQADLARDHGLTGFIYWHYWLGGRTLLERPFNEVVSSGEPDFPFCLAWANHSWERRWGFDPKKGFEMLLEQTYPGPQDDRAHFEHLRTAFEDPRYVRINGKPVFFVFEPGQIPDTAHWVERWQSMAEDLGGLYLVAMMSRSDYRNHVADGFDAATFGRLPINEHALVPRLRRRLINRNIIRAGPERYAYCEGFHGDPPSDVDGTVVPVVTANWDNTPRRKRRGVVIEGATPEKFASQIPGAVAAARRAPAGEEMVIIRSWNEWGEGNYLEPDQEFGLGWLEALATSLSAAGV
jgi:lipopolysaccharide biosynthesis protein